METVSILVLMEDDLKARRNRWCSISALEVSILVLMEDDLKGPVAFEVKADSEFQSLF